MALGKLLYGVAGLIAAIWAIGMIVLDNMASSRVGYGMGPNVERIALLTLPPVLLLMLLFAALGQLCTEVAEIKQRLGDRPLRDTKPPAPDAAPTRAQSD